MSTSPLVSAKYDLTNSYFASAIVELDSHKVRIQAVTPSENSINSAFQLGCKLSSMNWGYLSNDNEKIENEFLAIGLVSGVIQIYSPFSNELLVELPNPEKSAVIDFHYSKISATAWSCDISGNICEWNLQSFNLIQKFNISDFLQDEETTEIPTKISTIMHQDKKYLLIATQSVYVVDIETKSVINKYPAHVQPIGNLLPIPNQEGLFLTSAEGDRFINLYSITKLSTVSIFVAQSSVTDLCIGGDPLNLTLSCINEDGAIEIFNNFLNDSIIPSNGKSSSSKKKKRQTQSRNSDGMLKLERPNKSASTELLKFTSITISNSTLVYSWFENASIPYFDTIKLVDDSNNNCITGTKKVLKARPDFSATKHSSRGHDIAAPKLYNEGNAIVSDGTNLGNVQDNSEEEKDDDEEEEEEEESLAEKLEKLSSDIPKKSKKNITKKKLGANTSGTLTIILTQALKNNDHSLLETVLSNRDPNVIQKTITKLDSSLAVKLLDRLAERLARQATRFDQLNFWLKWIIIIHGGTLSSLPNLNAKLSNLHAILSKKGDVLPRLLELQGRLNLLNQQIELKREIIEDDFEAESDEEEDVEYVEELDDAQYNGDLSDDEDLHLSHDDYEDEDEDEDEDDYEDQDQTEQYNGSQKSKKSKKQLNSNEELPEDEEGYSDVEIEVHNDAMDDDDDDEEEE